MKKEIYQYYTEGKDEQKLLNTLKQDLKYIKSGKVEVFNAIQNQFTLTRIRTLRPNTTVVLVYDTDTDKIDILQKNIKLLNSQRAIKQVLCVPQVKNLEDELSRACEIKNASQLTRSNSKKEFKKDLISCSNLAARLTKCNFDISKLWNCVPQNNFNVFGNDAEKIKL